MNVRNEDNQNFISTAVAYGLRVQGSFLTFTKLSSHYDINVGADWSIQRWVGLYIYSTSLTAGFGVYVPNYIGGGPYFEYNLGFAISLSQFQNIPNYKLRFGTDLSGTKPPNLIREVNIYLQSAHNQASSPYTIEDILRMKNCPNLVRTGAFSCTDLWAHYKLETDYISPDLQTIYDLSGNGNSAKNGMNDVDTTNDGTLLLGGGMQFDGSQYITGPQITGPVISYAYVFKATVDPTVTNIFQWSASLLMKYMPGDIGRIMTGGNFLDGNCGPLVANTEYLFSFTVLKQSAGLTYLSLFIDGSLCISDNILASFPPIQASQVAFITGVVSEIWILKVALGAESFANPTLLVSCAVGEYYDNASNTCQACNFKCTACTGPLETECVLCISTAYLSSPSTCQCLTNYYEDTLNQQCTPCSSSCLTCNGSSSSNCLSCANGISLVGSNCVCPNNFSNIASVCVCNEDISADGVCQGCGDGVIQFYEQCDDGNSHSGDGCSDQCSLQEQFLCTQQTGGHTSCSLMHTLAIVRNLVVQEQNIIKVKLFLNRKVLFTEFGDNDLDFTIRGLEESEYTTQVVSKTGIEDSVIQIDVQPLKSFQTDTVVFFISQQYLDVTIRTSGSVSSYESFLTIPTILSVSDLSLPEFDYLKLSEEKVGLIFGPIIESIFGTELVLSTLGKTLFQMAMQPLWCAVDVNQLIFFIPAINVPLPRNSMIFFEALSFFTGDFYLFELGYEQSVGVSLPPSNNSAYNSRFDILGYESSSIIENCGVAFCILLILLILLIFVSLLSKASTSCKCIRICSSKMIWTPFIRLLFQVFLQFIIFAIINIFRPQFSTITGIIAFSVSVIVLLTLLLFMVKLMFVTAYPYYELTDQMSTV